MSIKITTTQNNVTVSDANKTITIINNNEPNRVTVVQPESSVLYVATVGPQGPQGPQGSAGTGGGGSTDTGSLLTTASVDLNTITFTKGNASQFSVTIATGSATDITALNNFSGSILTFTSSIQTQVNSLTSATSSYLQLTATQSMLQPYVLSNATQSMLQPYVLTSVTSSMIVSGALTSSYMPNAIITASVDLNTITFTKGNASQFIITVNTGSGGSVSGDYVPSSWTGSSSSQFAGTASYVSGSVFTSTNRALSASYAITASYAMNGGGGGTPGLPTGSIQLNDGNRFQGSSNFTYNIESSSLQLTGSFNQKGTFVSDEIALTTTWHTAPTGSNVYELINTGDRPDQIIWDLATSSLAQVSLTKDLIVDDFRIIYENLDNDDFPYSIAKVTLLVKQAAVGGGAMILPTYIGKYPPNANLVANSGGGSYSTTATPDGVDILEGTIIKNGSTYTAYWVIHPDFT